MARRKRARLISCRDCGDWCYDHEQFFHGLCDTCRQKRAAVRRAQTGARALANAKDAGTVDRDGTPYRLVVLPPKRRSGRRIR